MFVHSKMVFSKGNYLEPYCFPGLLQKRFLRFSYPDYYSISICGARRTEVLRILVAWRIFWQHPEMPIDWQSKQKKEIIDQAWEGEVK